MSKTGTGVVVKVNSKTGKSAAGRPYTLFSMLVLDPETDTKKWYNCAFTKPECEEGDDVEFEYEYDKTHKTSQIVANSVVVTGSSDVQDDDDEDEEQEEEAPKPKPKAKSKQPAKTPAKAAKATPSKAAAGDKESYWSNKEANDIAIQHRISFSWATTAAIQIMERFQAAGGEVALGKNKKHQLGAMLNEISLVRDVLFRQVLDSDYIQSVIDNKPLTVKDVADAEDGSDDE